MDLAEPGAAHYSGESPGGRAECILLVQIYSAEAPELLWILAASAFPVSLNYVYFNICRVEKKIRSVFLLTGFTAAITLGLTYALIPIMFAVADNQRCGYTHLPA
jgi:hypothetical protein